jgi:hypothetical protein
VAPGHVRPPGCLVLCVPSSEVPEPSLDRSSRPIEPKVVGATRNTRPKVVGRGAATTADEAAAALGAEGTPCRATLERSTNPDGWSSRSTRLRASDEDFHRVLSSRSYKVRIDPKFHVTARKMRLGGLPIRGTYSPGRGGMRAQWPGMAVLSAYKKRRAPPEDRVPPKPGAI